MTSELKNSVCDFLMAVSYVKNWTTTKPSSQNKVMNIPYKYKEDVIRCVYILFPETDEEWLRMVLSANCYG